MAMRRIKLRERLWLQKTQSARLIQQLMQEPDVKLKKANQALKFKARAQRGKAPASFDRVMLLPLSSKPSSRISSALLRDKRTSLHPTIALSTRFSIRLVQTRSSRASWTPKAIPTSLPVPPNRTSKEWSLKPITQTLPTSLTSLSSSSLLLPQCQGVD